MRTTALLILLVVLVSTGEVLRCNTMNGGTEECPADIAGVCAHYKSDKEEMKGCWIQAMCDEDKAALAAGELEEFTCCYEDLCN
uniref:Plethodontid modulating factor n=1 Tax=Plethodon ventralis TaxID=315413 RepID=Q0GAI8_9SALA|nr:plethodontid modulating factor [Plethodon ventralis]ABI48778.1 plethodontid modulating factor [Plethodon ventralis]